MLPLWRTHTSDYRYQQRLYIRRTLFTFKERKKNVPYLSLFPFFNLRKKIMENGVNNVYGSETKRWTDSLFFLYTFVLQINPIMRKNKVKREEENQENCTATGLRQIHLRTDLPLKFIVYVNRELILPKAIYQMDFSVGKIFQDSFSSFLYIFFLFVLHLLVPTHLPLVDIHSFCSRTLTQFSLFFVFSLFSSSLFFVNAFFFHIYLGWIFFLFITHSLSLSLSNDRSTYNQRENIYNIEIKKKSLRGRWKPEI